MYSTCLVCRAPLGRNDVIAIFPTGLRIAFDPVKGRLWVICPRCSQWNLSPLEERLEVLDECEERFRGARARFSTDNVALAQVAPSLDLVRIGRAPRPEFAAWRYGPKLRRRRAEMRALVWSSFAVAAGIGVDGMAHRVFGLGAVYLGVYGYSLSLAATHNWRPLARVDAGADFVDVRGQDLHHVRVFEREGDVALHVRHSRGTLALTGSLAIGAARVLLPWMNRGGGSGRQVTRAIALLDAQELDTGRWSQSVATRDALALGIALSTLPPERRLAAEIAANENLERRAMEGELALLERAWRDAEEVAAIADNLLVPPFVQQWLERAKRRD